MFSLTLYLRNTLSSGTTSYTMQTLEFNDFFIGRRRDERNLLVIRTFCEGQIIVNDPNDFDTLEDYFYFTQDGILFNGTDSYDCQVKFKNPNFTTKNVNIEVSILDKYSALLDGGGWNTWGLDQQPTITKEFKTNELSSPLTTYFVDGSQYMYDNESSGSELWGIEYVIVDTTKDVYKNDCLKFNEGGEGQSGNELTIDALIPDTKYIDQYYKPFYVKWDNSAGSGPTLYFQDVYVTYAREFRYFEQSENVPDGWEITESVRIKGIYRYVKYVRQLYGDQTYFTNKDVYHIRDEYTSSDYITVQFAGYNTELQYSSKFYNLNDLLEQLLDDAALPFNNFVSQIPDDYYVCLLDNYNGNDLGIDRLKIQPYIDFLRDNLRIYFRIDGDTVYFQYLNFPNKYLDIDDHSSKNWYPLNEQNIPELTKEVEFASDSWQLDFRSQILSFYGYGNVKEQRRQEITTNLESTQKNGIIMIDTREVFHDQIYETWTLGGSNTGTEALHISPDGKFIWWNYNELVLDPYVKFEISSNKIYMDVDDEIQYSYDVRLYNGAVVVTIGDYQALHTVVGSIQVISGTTTYTAGNSFQAAIQVDAGGAGFPVVGFISNFSVKVKTKVPDITTGVISGRSLKNGKLATANMIVDQKPLVDYKRGYLTDYGPVNGNANYTKEIEFPIRLDESLFDWDMNKFWELGSEQFIPFEEKRQVYDINTIDEFTLIKAKSNEVY